MLFVVAILALGAVPHVLGACKYEIKDVKINTCGKEPDAFKCEGLGAELTPNCDVRVKGCCTFKKDMNNLHLNYVAKKDGLQVMKGTKEVCKETLFGDKLECPFKSGTKMCAKEHWVQKVGEGAMRMAVGALSGKANIKASTGDYCFAVSATVAPKK